LSGNYDTFERQLAERNRLDMALMAKQEDERRKLEAFVTRFKAKASKAKQAIVRFDDVALGYGDLIVLRKINQRIDPDDRIGILGKNGQGKSTFAKAIMDELQPLLLDPAKPGFIKRNKKLRIGISRAVKKHGYFSRSSDFTNRTFWSWMNRPTIWTSIVAQN